MDCIADDDEDKRLHKIIFAQQGKKRKRISWV